MKKIVLLLFTLLSLVVCEINAQQKFECEKLFIEYNPMTFSYGHNDVGENSNTIKKGISLKYQIGNCKNNTDFYLGGTMMAAYAWDSKGKGDYKISQSYLVGGGSIDFGYAAHIGDNSVLLPTAKLLVQANGGWLKEGNDSSKSIEGIKVLGFSIDLGVTLHLNKFALQGGYTIGISHFAKETTLNMLHVGIGFDI